MKRIFTIISIVFLIFLLILDYTVPSSVKDPSLVHENTPYGVSLENMLLTVEILADRIRTRTAGSENERKAADIISEAFESYGLKVERKPFGVNAYVRRTFGFSVNGKDIEAAPVTMSPSTAYGGITGELVDAGLGREEDFRKIDASGKVALVKIGEISLREKAENALKAGCPAFVCYDDDHRTDRYFMNSVGTDAGTIPGVTIGDTDGEDLKARLASGEILEVSLDINAEIVPMGRSQNIVATLEASKGVQNPKTLIIGAHYDSRNSPGANDNASGIAALLETARILSGGKHGLEIKFAAFGSEEILLTGSRSYADSMTEEETKNTVGVVIFDTIGHGNTVLFLLQNTEEIPGWLGFFTDSAGERGEAFSISADANSDHIPFAAKGIPAVCVNRFPYPYIHTYRDGPGAIQAQAFYVTASIGFAAISEIVSGF